MASKQVSQIVRDCSIRNERAMTSLRRVALRKDNCTLAPKAD